MVAISPPSSPVRRGHGPFRVAGFELADIGRRERASRSGAAGGTSRRSTSHPVPRTTPTSHAGTRYPLLPGLSTESPSMPEAGRRSWSTGRGARQLRRWTPGTARAQQAARHTPHPAARPHGPRLKRGSCAPWPSDVDRPRTQLLSPGGPRFHPRCPIWGDRTGSGAGTRPSLKLPDLSAFVPLARGPGRPRAPPHGRVVLALDRPFGSLRQTAVPALCRSEALQNAILRKTATPPRVGATTTFCCPNRPLPRGTFTLDVASSHNGDATPKPIAIMPRPITPFLSSSATQSAATATRQAAPMPIATQVIPVFNADRFDRCCAVLGCATARATARSAASTIPLAFCRTTSSRPAPAAEACVAAKQKTTIPSTAAFLTVVLRRASICWVRRSISSMPFSSHFISVLDGLVAQLLR